MTSPPTRALVGLVLGSVLMAGCSGDDSGASTGDDSPGQRSTGSSPSPTGQDGELGGAGCGLDRERLGFVVRDWARVMGSIGRGDHPKYTGALVATLTGAQAAAKGCQGATQLTAFLSTARRVHARSRRATPDYGLYDAASAAGNAWLAKAGYGDNALSVD